MPALNKTAAGADGARKRKPAPARKRVARDKLQAKAAPLAAPAFDLSAMLAQAGWMEADEALAKALRDFAALEKVSQSLGRKLRGSLMSTHAQQVEDALLAASQALRHAGRKRNLQRFGEVGAVVAFDERLHALTKSSARTPAQVKIVAQGVMRGLGPDAEIVLKALAAPARSSTGAARKGV